MAYCTWNSNDGDLYVFEHCDGGFVIHVAGGRLTGRTQMDLRVYEEKDPKEFTRRFIAEVARQECEPIGLPYGGQSFYHIPTWVELRSRMLHLRNVGYVVALDRIAYEIGRGDDATFDILPC